jgi:hypothetical protein
MTCTPRLRTTSTKTRCVSQTEVGCIASSIHVSDQVFLLLSGRCFWLLHTTCFSCVNGHKRKWAGREQFRNECVAAFRAPMLSEEVMKRTFWFEVAGRGLGGHRIQNGLPCTKFKVGQRFAKGLPNLTQRGAQGSGIRPSPSAGAKGAESGAKGRQIWCPFHSDVHLLHRFLSPGPA